MTLENVRAASRSGSWARGVLRRPGHRSSAAANSSVAPKWGRRLDRTWRRLTARLRALPDFVIVGAQKAGTTSLYAYLAAEPSVLPARLKELHFFDTDRWTAGPSAYRSEFPLRLHLWLASRWRRRPVTTGEATPYYLYHPLAAERLARTAPDAKIIIMLRDPVERCLSHYWHAVRGGRETQPLVEALRHEQERLASREEALIAGESPSTHLDHRFFSYVDRSRYARQVARYLDLFPADRVLVLKSEDLFEDSEGVKERLSRFLGIPPLTRPFLAENVGARVGDGAEGAVREALAQEFAEDEAALQAMLGSEFTWRRGPIAGRQN